MALPTYEELRPCAGTVLTPDGDIPIAPTGTWRVMRPVVNQEVCVGCNRCILFCPDGIVYKEDDQIIIDYGFCKGCGICAHECRAGAIAMIPEP